MTEHHLIDTRPTWIEYEDTNYSDEADAQLRKELDALIESTERRQ